MGHGGHEEIFPTTAIVGEPGGQLCPSASLSLNMVPVKHKLDTDDTENRKTMGS